jgi:riboflavin kinase/FMN adenylyltransferase
MQIHRGLSSLATLALAKGGTALTIGNFDGVHRGHQRILQSCRTRGQPLIVVTFEPHPLTVLRPKSAAPRLTPAAMKLELLAALGTDVCVVLAPEPAVLSLSAEDFWALLRDQLRPKFLIEGPDFNFGRDRRGNVQKLAEWAAGGPVAFELVEPLTVALLDLSLVGVSSSLIRWLLSNGRVRDAAICLGRPYALHGLVVKGFQRGRSIGVPTANLQCDGQLIPADGIYAGRCRVGSRLYSAAVSIGNMPTFGEGPNQIEAHLLDFDGDLYGQTLDLELLDWLRDQTKFSGLPALKAGIEQDIVQTRRRTALDVSAPIAETSIA